MALIAVGQVAPETPERFDSCRSPHLRDMALISISCEEAGSPSAERVQAWCMQLEEGAILYFPSTPVAVPENDVAFLRGQHQSSSFLHKNIAYKPGMDKLSGVDTKTADEKAVARLHGIMRQYSNGVTAFLTRFLAPYRGNWRLDYTSFRPHEEKGRDLSLHQRNDLLHTDAFPTRPTYGARILRFFNNIHASRTRDWVISDPFATTVRQFVPEQIAPRVDDGFSRAAKSLGRSVGLGAVLPSIKRSPYDDFMMRFHNFLKENGRFQSECPKYNIEFPPGSSWMVYTDTVPHAVLAGQYALEQTYMVSPEALVAPETSPLRVLESMTAAPLV